MEQLKYDDNGYLTPYDKIQLTYTQLIQEFVLSNQTPKRLELFQDLSNFLEFMDKFISKEFELWIGGSFVSKKDTPSDIDILLFLEQCKFDNLENTGVLDFMHRSSKSMFNIDLYILPILETDQEDFVQISEKINSWKNNFIQYSDNVSKRGFVSIEFKNLTIK